ncbi:hypothetical protein A3B87_03710 [Candidatus Kuenenbacteria bacterium RIFCSPHIGHO2_02_FULL_39_13]|uniref:Uncharacterized protein n=1 Tax=Candidatus Kuenenbacteria bacterium RIFCSPHIGHO2_02_FULL_39_13 TaxID=1798561 RepID=A0A1F6FMK5_9BACT|nr:MAG: hypothetical protein A3B87_03710 [Candidatus Kuenenbacteria bacterium RIFCSPHIGHO2_02_FULL_39_13]
MKLGKSFLARESEVNGISLNSEQLELLKKKLIEKGVNPDLLKKTKTLVERLLMDDMPVNISLASQNEDRELDIIANIISKDSIDKSGTLSDRAFN